MNNTYKLKWSHNKQCFVVTAETVKNAGKKACGAIAPILGLTLSFSISTPLYSAPQGGVVSNGSAAIAHSGVNTTITQTSSKAVIDWSSFNIGKMKRRPLSNQVSAQSHSIAYMIVTQAK